MSKKIFIVSGGTGGHIIPARCLAEELSLRGNFVIFLGDSKIKSYIKNTDNFTTQVVQGSQLKKSLTYLIKASLKIALGVLQSIYLIAKHRPTKIIAFGGYASFPVLVASVLTKKEIIIHEQNAHLGKVNRIFAKYAKKIATSFPATTGIDQKFLHKVFLTGNPVRKEILSLNNFDYKFLEVNETIIDDSKPKVDFDASLSAELFEVVKKQEKINIFILGGSGGAKIFSEILPKAFFCLSEELKHKIHIIAQCRQELVESTFQLYKSLNLNAEVQSFYENIAEILKDSNLVIARSGSSSLAEFCVAKRPMILVPFALSADNHQLKNANYIQENGGAIVIQESDFKVDNVSNFLNQVLTSKDILRKMSNNCAKLAVVKATLNLANLIDN